MPRLPIRRVLAAFLSLAICIGASSPAVAQDERAGAGYVEWTFPREVPSGVYPHGSMRIRFVEWGAGVWWIRLLDHYSSPEHAQAAREGRLRAGNGPIDWSVYYAAVDMVESGVYSLVLEEAYPQDPRFPDVEIDRAKWTLHEPETVPGPVRWTLDGKNGLVLEKVFSVEPGRRDLAIEIAVRATKDFGRDVGTSIPLVLTGVTMSNPREEHILGQNPSVAFAVTERAGTSERTSHALHPGKDGEQTLASRTGAERILFAGSTNRHFAAFLWGADEDAEKDLQGVRVRTWPVQEPVGHHVLHSVPQAVYRFSLQVPPEGGRSVRRFRLYLGPKTTEVFEERPEYERFDAIMDYDLRPLCFCSVPGVRLLARTLLWGMRGLHSIVGNWGLAIVLLTLIVRSLLVPLNFRMQKSMRAYGAKMSRLQPELEKLKKKYANDPKRMQQEMLAFQRKHKLFPPLGGCLPLLVTIPVFFGLFTALRVAYELRYQPFVAWIDDLSSPDRLFQLGLDLGFVHLEYFNLLPILMVVLWFVLQLGTPLPTDPQQRQVMKIMRFMPLLFGVFLYNYASGLMVYMITSSLFGIAEQRVVKKILGPIQPQAAGVGAMPTF